MSDEERYTEIGRQNDGEPTAVVEEPTIPVEEVTPEPEPVPEVDPEEHKKKTGSQRAREKAQRLEVDNDLLRRENESLRRMLPGRAEEPTKPVVKDEAPKLADFDYDEAAFQTALIRHEAKKIVAEERARDAQEAERREWDRKMEEGRKKFEDFDEVLADAPQPSQILAKKLVKATTTPEVLHYLGTHLDEYSAINRMKDPDDVADALADIKVRLRSVAEKPAPKKVSTAPAPIAPLTGVSAVVPPKRRTDTYQEIR